MRGNIQLKPPTSTFKEMYNVLILKILKIYFIVKVEASKFLKLLKILNLTLFRVEAGALCAGKYSVKILTNFKTLKKNENK